MFHQTDEPQGDRPRSGDRDLPIAVHLLARRTWPALVVRVVILLSVLSLLSCAPLTTIPSAAPPPAEATSALAAHLRALSEDPVIQQAAQYHIGITGSEPEAPAVAAACAPESPASVRTVLARYVDNSVLVAYLVSSGSSAVWTACDSAGAETANIPASTIPSLAQSMPGEIGVYRLADRHHLMLVHRVVAKGEVVGAVGFILRQDYSDPVDAAQATQLS